MRGRGPSLRRAYARYDDSPLPTALRRGVTLGLACLVILAVGWVLFPALGESPGSPSACERKLSTGNRLPAEPPADPGSRPALGYDPYNRFGNAVGETEIRQIADAMVTSGLQAAGYRYLVIDDSWQGSRDASGVLQPDAAFPCGIALLAKYVHSRGLLFGIYTSPAAHSCAGHTGSAGHEQTDATTFATWGVDYVKLDWCGADYSPAGAQAIARRWSEAIARTGRPMVLSVNAGGDPSVAGWASGVVTSWRTGDDVCASWFNKTRPPAAASRDCFDRVYHAGIVDYLNSPIETSLRRVSPGHWADPDMLEVGNPGLSADEARVQMSMWAMWSAPLIAGNDPRAMRPSDEATRTLTNREIIDVDQDPLAHPGCRRPGGGAMQTWVRPLAGRAAAVMFVNTGDRPAPASLSWEDLGLTRVESVRDLWRHASAPIGADGVSATVPAHGVVALRVTGAARPGAATC